MTDQERLEKIKDKYMEREYDYALSSMDIDWLISTVKEQQDEIEGRKDFESRRIHQVKNLIERNKRFKRALEFYADERNYVRWNPMAVSDSEINKDRGKRARQELEGRKHES